LIYLKTANNVQESHTVQEFIELGGQNKDNLGYNDYSYIETREKIEYTVKNVLDDYYTELFELAKEVKLADWAVREYRGNPKKLSNKLYGSTRYWHIILRLNGMAGIHEFNLENHKLMLVEPSDLFDFMTKVYDTEQIPVKAYKQDHSMDETPVTIERYIYVKDPSRKFDYY
jgi:hypothetical protein